jgi:hypothetical protein
MISLLARPWPISDIAASGYPKLMSRRMAATLLSVVVLIASCERSDGATRSVSMLGLNPARAERDAREAVAAGDTRLLAVAGFSLEAPGSGLNIVEAENTYGVLEIEGTSDVHQWPGEGWLNERARDYAERYNLAIVTAHNADGI